MGQVNETTKQIEVSKGDQRFVMRYDVGQESRVLDELIAMVHKRELGFDWYDAAVMSHALGQHLAKEAKSFLPKKASKR